jgi:hypothetical protein
MVAAAIPDAMLVPTDVGVEQEAQLPVHDGLACPKHALSNSNPGSWLAMKETSRLHFEGRRLLPLNDAATGCQTSLMYSSPVIFPRMVTKSNLQ